MFLHTGKRSSWLPAAAAAAATILVLAGCEESKNGTPVGVPPGQGDVVTDVHVNSEDFTSCLPTKVKHVVVYYWNDDDKGVNWVSLSWNVEPKGAKHQIVSKLDLTRKVPDDIHGADKFQPNEKNLGHLFTIDVASGAVRKYTLKAGAAKSDDAKKILFKDGGISQDAYRGPYTAEARNWGVIVANIPPNAPGTKKADRRKIRIQIEPSGPWGYNLPYINDCDGASDNNPPPAGGPTTAPTGPGGKVCNQQNPRLRDKCIHGQ